MQDEGYHYLAPGGRDYTLKAARLAGVTEHTRVLDVACGRGETAICLAEHYGCTVLALDVDPRHLMRARQRAIARGVDDIVSFEECNCRAPKLPARQFDYIVAEGGALSFIGRKAGLTWMRRALAPDGMLSFSDLIFLVTEPPERVRRIYEDPRFLFLTEERYRKLIEATGWSIKLLELMDRDAWDNYYGEAARRLTASQGEHQSRTFASLMADEIDLFYRGGGHQWVGYLMGLLLRAQPDEETEDDEPGDDDLDDDDLDDDDLDDDDPDDDDLEG